LYVLLGIEMARQFPELTLTWNRRRFESPARQALTKHGMQSEWDTYQEFEREVLNQVDLWRARYRWDGEKYVRSGG